MKSLIPILALGTLFVSVASAQPRGDRPHGPPPEAFSACESQEEGTMCEFEGRRGTVEGTCQMPHGDRLVCVPNNHERPPRGRE